MIAALLLVAVVFVAYCVLAVVAGAVGEWLSDRRGRRLERRGHNPDSCQWCREGRMR